jgi:AraC-like DNA-binding protein
LRPLFEKVTVPEGASWSLLHRRLDDGIPFAWHYHPEFELTLTLNSRGQRYIGDSIEAYDDGDLVLLGPNLPHTWCSAERIDARQPHIALVMWFTEAWAGNVTAALAEMRPVAPLLARAGRGISFSRKAAAAVRPIIEAIPDRAPADRLLRLMEVLSLLAADAGDRLIAGASSHRARLQSPDQDRVKRVLDYLHAHYR